ncbi:MAG: ABC transporter permease [Ignavibacteria bacterium]|nr:ABC transporter permease [Ignavibacteria bacterium]MCC7159415.1 ABC transporter permease [Ignavibacteria bacterium]
MTRLFDWFFDRIEFFFLEIGRISMLIWGIFLSFPRIFRDRKLILNQMEHIGVGSIPLVIIIGFFTGAVSAWQAAYQFQGFISLSYLGSAVTKAIFIELGPVLTAIVLAGRVGASIAAELGTMKVTEQIDALESLAINPVRYLVMPRFLASIIMLPVLTIIANLIAIMGAFGVAYFFQDVSFQVFFNSAKRVFEIKDIAGGLIKAFFFGASISILGCHVGLNAMGGAQGVGNATIRAFVLAASMVLVLDYVLWTTIFG